MRKARSAALSLATTPPLLGRQEHIVALAARYAISAIYDRRKAAVAGGLMSYGTDIVDMHRQQGVYVARISSKARNLAASGGSAGVKPTLRERQSWSHTDLLIRRHMNELAKLESKIVTEPDPARAAKLVKQQEIKMRFIERLRAEQIENVNARR
jgi:hypothetical protein